MVQSYNYTQHAVITAAYCSMLGAFTNQTTPPTLSLSQPLLHSASGSDTASGSDKTFSPLPPSASKAQLDDPEELLHRQVPLTLESGSTGQSDPSPAKPVPPTTSWSSAASHALPITLMNIALAHMYAHLITIGTPLDPALVAAMHVLGSIVVQSMLLCTSGVARFAIAAPDVTVALLARATFVQICVSHCHRSNGPPGPMATTAPHSYWPLAHSRGQVGLWQALLITLSGLTSMRVASHGLARWPHGHRVSLAAPLCLTCRPLACRRTQTLQLRYPTSRRATRRSRRSRCARRWWGVSISAWVSCVPPSSSSTFHIRSFAACSRQQA